MAGVDVIRHGAPLELHPDGKCTKFVICPCPLQISSLRTFLPRYLGVVRIIVQQIQSPTLPQRWLKGTGLVWLIDLDVWSHLARRGTQLGPGLPN